MHNLELMIENFKDRNIEVSYYNSREKLISDLTNILNDYNTIGIGNSVTLKSLRVTELAKSLGKTVYDKTIASSKEESKLLKLKALTSECYVSSCNAIAIDGKIINVDHSGNRVAAITYGPERVIIIAGSNKIVKTQRAGVQRSLKKATPLNAKRAGIESPCSLGRDCKECTADTRVCNYISIIRGQNVKGRMTVMLIDEEIGF